MHKTPAAENKTLNEKNNVASHGRRIFSAEDHREEKGRRKYLGAADKPENAEMQRL